jgi:hypothetical protein
MRSRACVIGHGMKLTHSFQDVWVDLWSSSSDSSSRLGYWLGLYGAFSVLQALGLVLAVLYVRPRLQCTRLSITSLTLVIAGHG